MMRIRLIAPWLPRSYWTTALSWTSEVKNWKAVGQTIESIICSSKAFDYRWKCRSSFFGFVTKIKTWWDMHLWFWMCLCLHKSKMVLRLCGAWLRTKMLPALRLWCLCGSTHWAGKDLGLCCAHCSGGWECLSRKETFGEKSVKFQASRPHWLAALRKQVAVGFSKLLVRLTVSWRSCHSCHSIGCSSEWLIFTVQFPALQKGSCVPTSPKWPRVRSCLPWHAWLA